jgi:hypothetical protein
MSQLGQSRRFVHATQTSAFPSYPDVLRRRSEATLWAMCGHRWPLTTSLCFVRSLVGSLKVEERAVDVELGSELRRFLSGLKQQR